MNPQHDPLPPARGWSRRDFASSAALGLAGLFTGGCRSNGWNGTAWEDRTLADLRSALASGTVSEEQLVAFCLQRIARLDREGPALHAVIATNPDAMTEARRLSALRKSGRATGPLHGMPVLVKDNIDTADRMPTTGGSLALAGTFASQDAFVVRRLRDAGAVILGKANLSEWANFRSGRSVSGWSATGGQTRNPYALARTPWGSSAGSAAAVAAGYSPVAVGTETNGSIIAPAAACSIVGLKPTVGLVSRSGIIPIAESQDTAGPMARTVADAATLLGILAGIDPKDPATAEAAGHLHTDYTSFLKADSLRGKRIGVARQYFGYHPEVDRLIEGHFRVLRELGAELVDPVEFPNHEAIHEGNFRVMLHEFRRGLAAYFATRDDTVRVRSIADLIAFNLAHADRELSVFGQEILLQAEKDPELSEAEHRRLRDRCRDRARNQCIEGVMAQHRLDAFLAPSGAPPTHIDPVNRDHYVGGCTSLPAIAGCPHLTVPAGYVGGLPVGLSFFGARWTEGPLLGFGHAFEQATQARRKPRFLRDVPMPGPA
jgi:amidase